MIFLTIIIALLSINTHQLVVITSPLVTTFHNNQLPYLYANYGQIIYDKAQSFNLLQVKTTLCKLNSTLTKLSKPTFIVIRDDLTLSCSSTKQAIIAESLGAKGIMIASPQTRLAQGNIVLGDDGNGKRVHITSLYITEQTFVSLQKLSNIQITVKFPVPKQKVSSIVLYLSASKRSSYVFLRFLNKEYQYLKDYIDIVPIYYTFKCSWCPQQACYIDNYCSFDYDHFQINSGRQIISEQLHQYNIFKVYGTSTWMNYMSLFDQNCDYDWAQTAQCADSILNRLYLKEVGLAEPATTIEFWKKEEQKYAFDNFPEVAINGLIYRGNFDPQQIMTVICQSISNPPNYCSSRMQSQSHSHKYSLGAILGYLFLPSLLFVIASYLIYRRCIKKQLTNDMNNRVNELVANYASRISHQKKQKMQQIHEQLHEEL